MCWMCNRRWSTRPIRLERLWMLETSSSGHFCCMRCGIATCVSPCLCCRAFLYWSVAELWQSLSASTLIGRCKNLLHSPHGNFARLVPVLREKCSCVPCTQTATQWHPAHSIILEWFCQCLQGWKDRGEDHDEQAEEQPEDDEAFDDAAEQFEAQYNFRFEVCSCLLSNC